MRRKITQRRIRRLRASPRIVSLSGDVGFNTPLEEESREDEFDRKPPEETTPNSPQVVLSALMRPERESELPITIFTSVSDEDSTNIPRIFVPKRGQKRVTAIEIERVNSKGDQTYETRDEPPTVTTDLEILQTLTEDLLEGKLKLLPGQHILINLGRPAPDSNSMISINGDQAVRIAFTTLSGHLLSSSEIPEHHLPQKISIPSTSRIIHLFGFGNSNELTDHLSIGPNSISLNCSTDNTTAIGFQAHTRIIGIPNTTLVCRGGVVSFDRLSTDSKNSIYSRELLKKAKTVTFETGDLADTLVLVVNAESQESIQVSCNGSEIEGEPIKIDNGGLTAMIWNTPISESLTRKIVASAQSVGAIHSLMLMKGGPENWKESFQTKHWDTIVEEGALSNSGSSTIKMKLVNFEEKEVQTNARR
tara:strand:- start:2321 stop:3580 length:1260 start_codon:yes stop_codon:yes gene_type:complete